MQETETLQQSNSGRMKFIVGGLLIIGAIIYLIVSSTKANAQYFLTISEVEAKGASVYGRDLRISGAVIGDSISYDPETLNLSFIVADIPGDNKEIEAQGGLAKVLHDAVTDPQPDLLRDEAQAIMTGQLGKDGIFYADELLLKCPTKYEDAVPDQVEN